MIMNGRRTRLLVLNYHSVSDTWEDELAVTLHSFEVQIRMALRNGYDPTVAQDLFSKPGKLLSVSFDDAFRNIRGALAKLEAWGIPAIVFACPGYADDGRPFGVERLADSGSDFERLTMTWNELRELVAHGVEIGSHTTTHPRLTQISDSELKDELHGSKERLETELGRPCRFLAYPFGDHDARVRAAARAAGYIAAFGVGRYSPLDLFAIPRASFYRSDTRVRAAIKMSRLRPILASYRASGRERAGRATSLDADRPLTPSD